jgi:hypothetical protein
MQKKTISVQLVQLAGTVSPCGLSVRGNVIVIYTTLAHSIGNIIPCWLNVRGMLGLRRLRLREIIIRFSNRIQECSADLKSVLWIRDNLVKI